MTATILQRLATAIPTILLTTMLIFALRYFLPGGPVEAMLGGGAEGEITPEQVAALEARYGLDAPLPVQYWNWITQVVQGNLGHSYYSQQSVSTVLGQRVLPSLQLIVLSLTISIVFGLVFGIFAAVRRNHTSGRVVRVATGLGLSVPDFWLGTIAAGTLGLALGIFPAVGFTPMSEGLGPNLYTVILPSLVLSIVTGSFLARHVASAMSAALESPYIRTAWAMGIPSRSIYLNCALRNAVGPVITLIPLAFAGLVGGTLMVEMIFAIPGLGTEIMRSVTSQDYPIVQGIVLLIGVLVALLNLLSDVLLAVIDPRMRRATT